MTEWAPGSKTFLTRKMAAISKVLLTRHWQPDTWHGVFYSQLGLKYEIGTERIILVLKESSIGDVDQEIVEEEKMILKIASSYGMVEINHLCLSFVNWIRWLSGVIISDIDS